MIFTDRIEAGKKLAEVLRAYKRSDVVVYALPRGGVVLGVEVARMLGAPLDLLIPRKIGHPSSSEYAIAAVAEDGDIVANEEEVSRVDQVWFKKEVAHQRAEAKRRREKYLAGRPTSAVEGKTAIIVDDGIATGLTMKAAIMELKHRKPKKIVVAIPVIPADTFTVLSALVDEVVALDKPEQFLGAIGNYYKSFPQVEDEEVIALMALK